MNPWRRAHRLMRLDQWAEASRLFEEAAQRSPHDPRPRIWAALAAAEAGDFQRAETWADDALKRSGQAGAMAVLAAQICLDAQRYTEAWRLASRARQADPRNPLANAYAALALLAQDDYTRAAQRLHRQEIPDSIHLQCRLLLEAEAALERIRRHPVRLEAPLVLTPASFRLLPLLSRLQERWYGWKDRRRRRRADRFLARGQAQAAWKLASADVVLDSRFIPGQGPLMAFARPCFEGLAARGPDRAASDSDALELAEVAALVGEFDVARRQVHRLLHDGRTAPRFLEEAHLIAGLVHWWNGEPEAAAQAFQAILDRQPEDGLALYFLGLAHLRQGHRARARRTFRRLCRLEPGRGTQALLALRDELNRLQGAAGEAIPAAAAPQP